ncbi:hypothetical protein EV278_11914 [Caulobacter sp. BK020]|nr:hypothetical protein EV278_11914 [Caulobacter sp. BK020]
MRDCRRQPLTQVDGPGGKPPGPFSFARPPAAFWRGRCWIDAAVKARIKDAMDGAKAQAKNGLAVPNFVDLSI